MEYEISGMMISTDEQWCVHEMRASRHYWACPQKPPNEKYLYRNAENDLEVAMWKYLLGFH